MSIQCVIARKLSAAPFTGERSIIRVELLVPLAIVLPLKALPAPRPVAYERFLRVVRS